jgi:hypothetical protein
MTMVEEADPPKPGMRAKIVEEFGTLARLHGLQGPVLEIAHGPSRNAISLAPFLAGFERHVVIDGDSGEVDGTHFHRGDPNDMGQLFDDHCFSSVIWDRGLERDPFFWLTLDEIRRVLMPGGALMLCTRGFAKNNKFGIKVVGANGNPVPFLTATSPVSATGADYLRFSPQGLRKVVLRGLDVRELRSSFMVPHLFAVAVKAG